MPTPRIYLAPMEGVTTFVYRNAHAAVYGPLDKYFTPFLEPHEKRSMKTKERNEVLSEHNQGLDLVQQILSFQLIYIASLFHKLIIERGQYIRQRFFH